MAHSKKKYGIVVTILVLFVVAGATGLWLRSGTGPEQPKACSTGAPSREVIEAVNQALKRTSESPSHSRRTAGSVTIPVHFHIITNGSGSEGDVTDDAVNWQIAVLNAAFSGTAGPPNYKLADTPFRFSLGSIERIKNNDWFKMSYNELTPSDAEKQAMARNKGGKSALNIYTARLGDAAAGWARVPWPLTTGTGLGPGLDGVVLRYSTLPGGAPPPFDEGDTATHEVGHWLGLFHVFQSGCVDPGDNVNDTTFQAAHASGCYQGQDSCTNQPGNDPVENFMNTTNDHCMFRFTEGQSIRMDLFHMTYRL